MASILGLLVAKSHELSEPDHCRFLIFKSEAFTVRNPCDVACCVVLDGVCATVGMVFLVRLAAIVVVVVFLGLLHDVCSVG